MSKNKILQEYIKQIVTKTIKVLVTDLYGDLNELRGKISNLEAENEMLMEMIQNSNSSNDIISEIKENVTTPKSTTTRAPRPNKKELGDKYMHAMGINLNDMVGDLDYEIDDSGAAVLSEDTNNPGPEEVFLKKDYSKAMKAINVRGID